MGPRSAVAGCEETEQRLESAHVAPRDHACILPVRHRAPVHALTCAQPLRVDIARARAHRGFACPPRRPAQPIARCRTDAQHHTPAAAMCRPCTRSARGSPALPAEVGLHHAGGAQRRRHLVLVSAISPRCGSCTPRCSRAARSAPCCGTCRPRVPASWRSTSGSTRTGAHHRAAAAQPRPQPRCRAADLSAAGRSRPRWPRAASPRAHPRTGPQHRRAVLPRWRPPRRRHRPSRRRRRRWPTAARSKHDPELVAAIINLANIRYCEGRARRGAGALRARHRARPDLLRGVLQPRKHPPRSRALH